MASGDLEYSRGALKVVKSKTKGRMLVAARQIQEGECVLRERPVVSMTTYQRRKYVCDYCLNFNEDDVNHPLNLACEECEIVWFCSEKCKKKRMTTHSQFECHSFRGVKKHYDSSLIQKNLHNEQTLSTLFFLVRILNSRIKYKEDEEEDVEKPQKSPFDLWGGSVKANYKGLHQKKKRLINSLLNVLEETVDEEIMLETQQLRDLIAKEETNSHSLMYDYAHLRGEKERFSVEDDDSMYGFGAFVKSSLFNHSCAPNIFRRTKGGILSLYALRTIEKGEEVCITYVPLSLAANLRGEEIHCGYGFACNCERCDDYNVDLDFLDSFVCSRQDCGGLLIPLSHESPNKQGQVCLVCGDVLDI